jgi:hypothetical protein
MHSAAGHWDIDVGDQDYGDGKNEKWSRRWEDNDFTFSSVCTDKMEHSQVSQK